jgi:hypothetical protein
MNVDKIMQEGCDWKRLCRNAPPVLMQSSLIQAVGDQNISSSFTPKTILLPFLSWNMRARIAFRALIWE